MNRARAVDDEDESRVISRVFTANIRYQEEENTDPFGADAQAIKNLNGLDANAKRRLSNQINKYQRSIDGEAGTKQIETEAITGYDAFGVVMPPHNLDYLAKLYEVSSPHKAAVDAKVSNIVGLGYKFVESRKTKRALEEISDNEKKTKKVVKSLDEHKDDLEHLLEDFNAESTFTETLIKVWRDYEATGNGYLEVGRKRDGTVGYVGHIPSQTMRIRKDRDGFVQITANKAQFFKNFGDDSNANPLGGGKPNEVLTIRKYSPNSGYYGVPDIVAAMQAVAGDEFASRFNLDYFENKAVPRHIITLKGADLGLEAQASLLQFFETGLKGQNHRTIYVPLPGDSDKEKVEFKIEPIEAGIQDSSFNNYRKSNLEAILMVHRVPVTKVSSGSGTNLAVARDADKTFKEQVCAPEQKIFEKRLNRIIRELTDAFELKLNEMTLTDADTQSKIDERNVKNGIWLTNEVRARDGMPAIKGGNERVDLNAKDKIAQQAAEATTNRQRDSERSAGATDSAGEGRNPKGDGRTTP